MNKNLFKLLVALLCLPMLVSCDSSGIYDVLNSVEYYPVQQDDNGRWGFVDKDGNVICADEFEKAPSPVFGGVFTVKEKEGLSVYKIGEKPELVKGCENLKDAGIFFDGIIPVTRKGERIMLVNKDGETVATLAPMGGKEITACATFPTEGLLICCNEEGNFGVLNLKGEKVIDFKYASISPFNEGLAVAIKGKGDDAVCVILNKKGEEVAKLKKDFTPESGFFQHGFLLAQDKDGRYCFVDKKGEFRRLPAKVKSVSSYIPELYAYMDESGDWGLMDMKTDEVVLRAKYDELIILDDNTILATNSDDKVFTINKDGEKLISFSDYKSVTPLPGKGFFFRAREGSHYLLLDKEGKPVGKEEFSDMKMNFGSDFVESDYFDAAAVASALTGELTDKGLGKINIGQPISTLGLNPEDYVYDSSFTDEKLNKKGYKYSLTFHGLASAEIATREYSDFGFDSKVVMNQAATVVALGYSVDTYQDCWKELKAALEKALKGKGFKQEKSTDEMIVYSKGNIGVLAMDKNGEIGFLVASVNEIASLAGVSVESAGVAAGSAEDAGMNEAAAEGNLSGTYTGVVAGANVVLELTESSDGYTGRLRYTKVNPPSWLLISGYMDDSQLILSESNNEGMETGTYNLSVQGGKLTGSMVNFKGKSYSATFTKQ